MYFDQQEYDVRFEWGLSGVEALLAGADVIIIVDVLSFTTCVDIVVSQGGTVFPYRDKIDIVFIFPETILLLLPEGWGWRCLHGTAVDVHRSSIP